VTSDPCLREKNVRHSGISRNGRPSRCVFAMRHHEAGRSRGARPVCGSEYGGSARWALSSRWWRPSSPWRPVVLQDQALKQNITTLHNRINELGVAEPVIQQQGKTALWCNCRACRTPPRPRTSWGAPPRWKFASWTKHRGACSRAGTGMVPFGSERYLERSGQAGHREEAGDPDR
jgi:preprotein translocase subunit SecD